MFAFDYPFYPCDLVKRPSRPLTNFWPRPVPRPTPTLRWQPVHMLAHGPIVVCPSTNSVMIGALQTSHAAGGSPTHLTCLAISCSCVICASPTVCGTAD